jgi:nucleoside-diphosphate kinase
MPERTIMSERTYLMLKPDAVANKHIGEIIARIERVGLTIERLELTKVSPEQAALNYVEHEGKPFYDGLIAYITSGPVVKLIVSGPDAVTVARKLMGATNPKEAAPGTIRGDFGLIMDANVIHGSDSPASAEREIGIFFPA